MRDSTISQCLYAYGYMLEPRGPNHMVKNLRCDLSESEFNRFKKIKAQIGSRTNDEALKHLMDMYESEDNE